MSEKKNYFIAMWDMYGLECLYDADAAQNELTLWEKTKIVSILSDSKHPRKPNPIPLNMMILRARMNSQRQYEIYGFETTSSMTEIRYMFDKNHKIIAEKIRQCGNKIYSDNETDA